MLIYFLIFFNSFLLSNPIELPIGFSHEELSKKHLIGIKTAEINIYDITKKHKHKEKIRVNNHINRTGKTPLRSKEETTTTFYDITNIYHKTTKGITTTCLGNRYKKEHKKFKYPSTIMCQVVFILRAKGYKKIKGWLIPGL